MTYKKTASLFALPLLTACGTNPTGTTSTSTTSAFVGDQNNQGDDDHGDLRRHQARPSDQRRWYAPE